MVIREDLHLCYPSRYKPYDFDPPIPNAAESLEGLGKKGGIKERVRGAVIREVWGKGNTGLIGTLGRILSNSRFFRTRAFFGLVEDECLPTLYKQQFALDIGCGAGWMLKRLAKVGWQVEGIEWDENAAAEASKRSGERVMAGDFRTLQIPEGKYDLVVLNHVFEHLDDPIESISRFHDLLGENGKLVMYFPNAASMDSKHFKSCWFALDPPRHLIFPSANAVHALAKKAGFRNTIIRTNSAKWVWVNSRAYQLGSHPEQTKVTLSAKELLSIRLQQFLNAIGFRVGSEMVVVLQK